MKTVSIFILTICMLEIFPSGCKKKPTEPAEPTLHELVQKMSGKRTWHGTEVDQTGSHPDTTYYISAEHRITVLNDSTINMDSIYFHSTIAENPKDVELYFKSWDKHKKIIYFEWEAITQLGSSLTYYYETDSMAFYYGVGNPGGYINFDIHTP